MLGETITITHNTIARVLSRINQDNFAAIYQLRTSTEEFRVNVRHATESAKAGIVPYERHNFEFIHTTFATPTTVETTQIASFTMRCRRGDDPAATLLTAKAVIGFMSDSNVTKLIAWES